MLIKTNTSIRQQLESYHAESFGWALRCCNYRTEEAQDVLQTTYLKILEGKAKFSGKAKFRTWLFSIIRITAADFRRQEARYQKYMEKSAKEPTETQTPNPLEIYSEGLPLNEFFQKALAQLSDRQQQVLQLVFYHNMSIAEASEAMQLSIGSARTHYERGKARLRHLLNHHNVNE